MTQPGTHEQSPEAPVLSPERQASAMRYARINRWLSLAETTAAAIALLWLMLGGWGKGLVSWLGLPAIAAAVVYFVFIFLAYNVIFSPLGYYRSSVLGRRYGISKQGFGGWFIDYVKSGLLSMVLGAGLVATVYWFITIQPGSWWLIAWAMLVAVSFILSYLAPVVIVPLFFKTTPLADAALKERLEQLSGKAGVKIIGVYTIELSSKTSGANAALMGSGRTRRIALSDTLLASYTTEEIEVIVGHELGHQVNRDFIRLFAWQGFVLLASFWLTAVIAGALAGVLGFDGIGDAAAMPLAASVLLGLNVLFVPLSNAVTRGREAAADEFALKLTGQPQAFESMMTKLTDQNLTEAEPGRWVELLFNDHPSYRSRVEHARKYIKT